jgi:predicted nucleic acid-binding protein
MNAFFDASAFLKILKREENYSKVVERLTRVTDGRDTGYTDAIAIAEIVYAFLSQGLDEEAIRARTYIEGIPNLTILEEITTSTSHRGAELKKKYFKRSGRTFFSLYDGIHLALAEKHCEVFLTSDSDFKDVNEVKVEFI